MTPWLTSGASQRNKSVAKHMRRAYCVFPTIGMTRFIILHAALKTDARPVSGGYPLMSFTQERQEVWMHSKRALALRDRMKCCRAHAETPGGAFATVNIMLFGFCRYVPLVVKYAATN